MTKKELKRYTVIMNHIHGLITAREAAEILQLSSRQVYRLKKRVLEEGETGIIHKNKGRKPVHALTDEQRQTIVELYLSDRYKGSNYQHFAELLAEHEHIQVSSSKVRRVLQSSGIKSPRKRRPPKAHRPRQRKPQAGMLIQMDASTHRWLEDRAEAFTLHAAIDDATGKVFGAVFRPTEDLIGYFEVVKQVIQQEGIPIAIYTDRHTLFQSPKEKPTLEQELAGECPVLTQLGQALAELNISHPKARSPQAKGRIERLFGTFQDRLIIELRIRKVKTIEEANAILPELIAKHNERFQVVAQEAGTAYRPLPADIDLDQVLCYRDKRTIGPGKPFLIKEKLTRFKVRVKGKKSRSKYVLKFEKP